MRILVDTNRLSDFFRGSDEALKFLENATEIWIPYVAIGEIRSGFAGGKRKASNELDLMKLLQRDGVTVLYPNLQTTLHYAEIWNELRAKGTPIPANDIWIASLAVQHDLRLYTRDRHFGHVRSLLLA